MGGERQKESRAKAARQSARLIYPRPPLLRNSTKEMEKVEVKIKSSTQNPQAAIYSAD